jgi:hypothetical protein
MQTDFEINENWSVLDADALVAISLFEENAASYSDTQHITGAIKAIGLTKQPKLAKTAVSAKTTYTFEATIFIAFTWTPPVGSWIGAVI